jgi:hypothetical protein
MALKCLLLVKWKINELNYEKNIPESEVNLALKGVPVFSVFVILKLTVEVISKFDYISMISSTSGSVPSKIILYLHLDPSCFVIRKSNETFPGFIGLKINSY